MMCFIADLITFCIFRGADVDLVLPGFSFSTNTSKVIARSANCCLDTTPPYVELATAKLTTASLSRRWRRRR